MAEFLSSYGLWILLGIIFIAMHRFGMGCCGAGRHRHGEGPREEREPGAATAETKPEGGVTAGARSRH